MGSILKVENLKYKNILNGISLSIEEESFNVLMGSNGSGKTTLVCAIVGLIKYDGSIYFLNDLMVKDNIKELRKEIGVFSDLDSLLPGKVLYNITYPLLNLGYKETDAKKEAYEISKKLDIENLLNRDVADLSLFERKMVLFVLSIIHKPKLLIIDDSLDELDAYYREKVIKYMRKLNNNMKVTILFITNNKEDIYFANNIIFLDNGKIIGIKKNDEILDDEKTFIKVNSRQPFLVDLSNKLKSYELIEKNMLDILDILDIDEMVNKIWK